MPSRPASILVLLLTLVGACTAAPSHADSRADSLALFGAWTWSRSEGGLLGAMEVPPREWSRVLYFRRDGSYSVWETDSVGSYLIKSGRLVAYPSNDRIPGGRSATLWLNLSGWSDWEGDRQLIAFVDRDEILMYPGGGGSGVDDALMHTYVRDNHRPEPRLPLGVSGANESANRPPRMRRGLSDAYWIELPRSFNDLRTSFGHFSQWSDRQYQNSLHDSYRYAHYQIPSAVIGDFDGDSIADAAIQGRAVRRSEVPSDSSVVVCFLSNRGKPRAVRLLSELVAMKFTPSSESTGPGRRHDSPPSCLMLFPAGEVVRDVDGKQVTLTTDAILVVRSARDRTAFYCFNGTFREGKPISVR